MKCACGCSQSAHEMNLGNAGVAHRHSSTCGCSETATTSFSTSQSSSSQAEGEGEDDPEGESRRHIRNDSYEGVSHQESGAHCSDGCGCKSSHTEIDSCNKESDGCGDGCGCSSSSEVKTYERICLILAGVFLVIALAGEHIFHNDLVLVGASFVSIIAGLVIVLPETFDSLKAKSIDINVLMIVAIIGAIYVQAYEEAAAVLFLFSVGNYLEGRAMRKSNDAIKDLAKLAPNTALVVRGNQILEVPTDQVMLEETVAIKPGMSVPLDGIITKGASSFNDAAITGESVPVYKTVGDKVFAASLAVDGACEFITTSTVANSTLAKISELVADAQKQKSERETFVKKFARIYTPLVIVVAFLIALIPSLVTLSGIANWGDYQTWIYRACELLVISCPCAFVISTPVTVVSALTRAAKMGILVKGGVYFEEAAKVKAIAFDKTGTLTEGKPEVVDVILADMQPVDREIADMQPDDRAGMVTDDVKVTNSLGAAELFTKDDILRAAAALEQHSTHPLATAVITSAQQAGFDDVLSAEDITETAGKGISGTVQQGRYAIGSRDYISAKTGLDEELEKLTSKIGPLVGTTLFVAQLEAPAPTMTPIGESTKAPSNAPSKVLSKALSKAPAHLLGVFVVADKIRTDTSRTVAALQSVKQKLYSVMLTGDNKQTALAVAGEVGVNEVHASLLPQDKTKELHRLRDTYETIAFVGDGINDAPSIATANVGIAMGGAGSDAALSSADVVLMADDISALPRFFSLSTKTVAVLRQNVVLAIGLKVLVALLVVLGVASMWMAVLADTGVTLLVILNGMRLLRTKL